MNYLLHGQLPAGKNERDCVLRRVKANQRAPDGRIVHIMLDGQHRVIPPPQERVQLVTQWHEQFSHCGARRVLSMLARHFWWYGLA